MNKKYCSIIQIYILSISMPIQNLVEIHKLIRKILSINKILTSIKSHNSVKNGPKTMCNRYNMDLVFIIAYTKFYQNSSIYSEGIEEKHILYQSRAILSINKILTSIKGHNSVKIDKKKNNVYFTQYGSCIYQCIYKILSKFIYLF